MKRIFVGVVALALLNDTHEAFGYIDPTASGTLIQILLAGGTGILIFAQQIWRRIRARKRNRAHVLRTDPRQTSDTNAKDRAE
jgi:hypothetical protein